MFRADVGVMEYPEREMCKTTRVMPDENRLPADFARIAAIPRFATPAAT
jgi:hypothetical protein